MANWFKPALGTIVVVVASFIALWGVLWAIEPSTCVESKLSTISNQQNVPVFACWEFWLNRYQALIGSVITAAVALVTLRWIARTLTATNRQAFVAAAEGLRRVAAEISEERARMREFCEKTNNIRYHLNVSVMILANIPAAKENLSDFERHVHVEIDYLREINQRASGIGRNEARNTLIELLRDVQIQISAVKLTIENSPPIQYGGENSIANIKASKLDEIITTTRTMYTRLIAALDDDYTNTWAQIRKFERAAIHGSG